MERIEVTARKSERAPTVTVVVPVLNEESFLAKTLASLRNQTFTDFELIVVDNGSTDRSPEIARELADKALLEPKRGWVHAMHRGICEAQGDLIAGVDADTLYPPHWLAKMVTALERPEVVAVYGPMGFRESGPCGRKLEVLGCSMLAGLTRLGGVRLACGANLGMRRDAYFAVGGYPPLIRLASPDLRLVVWLAKLGKVRFVPSMIAHTANRRFARQGMVRGFLRAVWYWMDVALRLNRVTSDQYRKEGRT